MLEKHGAVKIGIIAAALAVISVGCFYRSDCSEAHRLDTGFVFLGDLHFDRPGHHNKEWVIQNYPSDITQIDRYCRITEDNTPALFAAAAGTLRSGPFWGVVQAGDFAEGLCGSYELQTLQFEEAKTFVQEYIQSKLFLITKGNHDVTGPQADRAYKNLILPWMSSQIGRTVWQTSYAVKQGNDLFIFFDSFEPDLDWLEETLRKSNARYIFFVTHKPVVPFDARSNWHLYADADSSSERERLVTMLGHHKAIVLCGHLHSYSLLNRKTPTGSFVQLAMNSVVDKQEAPIETCLSGTTAYGAELLNLEPTFSPSTLEIRKHLLESEKAAVSYFEYAKTAGYCLIRCRPDKIVIEIYSGCSRIPWKTYDIRWFGGRYSIAPASAGRIFPEIRVEAEIQAADGSFAQ